MFKPLGLERILCQKCAHGLGHVGAHLIPLILFLEAHDCSLKRLQGLQKYVDTKRCLI